MTYEEGKELLREKLDNVKLEYQEDFKIMEEKIEGSGNIHTHVFMIPNPNHNSSLRYCIGINGESNMPKNVQVRVTNIAEEILSGLE